MERCCRVSLVLEKSGGDPKLDAIYRSAALTAKVSCLLKLHTHNSFFVESVSFFLEPSELHFPAGECA